MYRQISVSVCVPQVWGWGVCWLVSDKRTPLGKPKEKDYLQSQEEVEEVHPLANTY